MTGEVNVDPLPYVLSQTLRQALLKAGYPDRGVKLIEDLIEDELWAMRRGAVSPAELQRVHALILAGTPAPDLVALRRALAGERPSSEALPARIRQAKAIAAAAGRLLHLLRESSEDIRERLDYDLAVRHAPGAGGENERGFEASLREVADLSQSAARVARTVKNLKPRDRRTARHNGIVASVRLVLAKLGLPDTQRRSGPFVVGVAMVLGAIGQERGEPLNLIRRLRASSGQAAAQKDKTARGKAKTDR